VNANWLCACCLSPLGWGPVCDCMVSVQDKLPCMWVAFIFKAYIKI
jgi:hypothetical protein